MDNTQLDPEVLKELIDKYDSNFSRDVVLDCLDNAIIKAVTVIFKCKTATVVWDEDSVDVYAIMENDMRRVEYFNSSLYKYILYNFKKCLAFITITNNYMTIKHQRVIGDLIIGSIINKDKKNIYIQIDDNPILSREYIVAKVEKRYQILKNPLEKQRYDHIGYKMLFLVRNMDIDPIEKRVDILLSRTSIRIPSKIIKLLMAKDIKQYYDYYHKPPIISCVKRVAGVISKINSSIHISREIIDNVRDLLSGESIYVKRIKR